MSAAFSAAMMARGSPAARMIGLERLRQMEVEGWDEAHDDRHTNNELYRAAASYGQASDGLHQDGPPSIWPWDKADWKPAGGRVRNMTKMGALLVAERDRIDRLIERTIEQLDKELVSG